MRRLAQAALGGLLSLVGPARAGEPPPPITHACRVQVGLVCRGMAAGTPELRACLEENADRVASGCRAAFLAVPEPAPPPRDLRTACRSDFERLCGDVGSEGSRSAVVACLREHGDGVSEECRAALAKPRARRKLDPAACHQAARARCPDAQDEGALQDCLRFYSADLPPECRPPSRGAR